MATIILTIRMCITWLPALMALAYYLTAYLLPQPIIKNKIFPSEFIMKIFFFHFIGIINNAAFQMKNIFKTIVQHVCAGLFAADAACAIHNDVLIFIFFQHINSHRQLLTKSIRRNLNCIFKMAYFIFIMVAHVNNNCVWIIC